MHDVDWRMHQVRMRIELIKVRLIMGGFKRIAPNQYEHDKHGVLQLGHAQGEVTLRFRYYHGQDTGPLRWNTSCPEPPYDWIALLAEIAPMKEESC